MTDVQYKYILDALFFYFEENFFINEGVWPRQANLVFAFSDYIEGLSDSDIAELLKTEDLRQIENFRNYARRGIEHWLKLNMKTLMM